VGRAGDSNGVARWIGELDGLVFHGLPGLEAVFEFVFVFEIAEGDGGFPVLTGTQEARKPETGATLLSELKLRPPAKLRWGSVWLTKKLDPPGGVVCVASKGLEVVCFWKCGKERKLWGDFL
jgi:hypothetical protein